MATARIALDRSAEVTAAAFAQVTAQLSDVRGGLSDLCARLADLGLVLGAQRAAVDVFGKIDAAVIAIRTSLQGASAVAAPARFDSAARTALTALAEIRLRTKELDAVATLTLVAARSLGLAGFDDYVANLRTLGTQMSDDVQRLGAAVDTLRMRRGMAAELFGQAGALIDKVASTLETASAERAETDRLLSGSLEEVATLASRLPKVAEAETDVLVRAMQFADAVAQRVDHIGQIIARSDGSAPALARAQLDALTQEIRVAMHDLGGSLDRIAAPVGEAARVLAGDSRAGESSASRALANVRKVLTQLADGSAQALSAIKDAAGESSALTTLSEEAADRFSSVFSATAAMHLAAINAALLARQDEGRERTMNVLSMEVRQQAASCEKASKSCHDAITQLSLADDLRAFAEVSESAGAFHASVADSAGAVETSVKAIAELDRLRQAASVSLDRLAKATSVARESLGKILSATETMAQLSADLPREPPYGSGEPAGVMNIYTMEAERAVHRRLFGLPDVPVQSLQVAADDPLAAILF